MMTLSLRPRREIASLLVLAMLVSFFVSAPVAAKAGFFSKLKSVSTTLVGVATGLVGATVGAAVGGVPGAIVGGVGGFLVGKGLSSWVLNHAGMIGGAVAGGMIGAAAGPVGAVAGTIIGGIVGHKLDKAIKNAASDKEKEKEGAGAATTANAAAQQALAQYKAACARQEAAQKKGDALGAQKALVERNFYGWKYYEALGDRAKAASAKSAWEKALAAYRTMEAQSAYQRYLEANKRYEKAVQKGDRIAAPKALADRNKAASEYFAAKGDKAKAEEARAAYEKCLKAYLQLAQASVKNGIVGVTSTIETTAQSLSSGGAIDAAASPFRDEIVITPPR